MIRFFLNAVGSVLLALSLVFAVADIAGSLVGDVVKMTPLGDALALMGLAVVPGAGQSQSALDVLALVSVWPASVALAAAAFLFLFLGRPRRRPQGRLSR